jgi:hypothetical protein
MRPDRIGAHIILSPCDRNAAAGPTRDDNANENASSECG